MKACFGALKCVSGFSIWEFSRGSVGYLLPSLAVQLYFQLLGMLIFVISSRFGSLSLNLYEMRNWKGKVKYGYFL